MPDITTTLRVPNYASAPGSPTSGQIYHNTTDHLFYYHNGTSFIALGSGSGDVVGPAGGVVDTQLAVFNATTGKIIKGGTGSGIATLASGVLGTTPDNHANWDTAFTNNLRWDGGATSLVAATGRASLAIGDAAVWTNGSGTGTAIAAVNIIIPGSTITIPAGAWKINGTYHCAFDMVKTSGGAVALIINVHMGTAGTTSDAIVGTLTFSGAGTSAADAGFFDVYVTFKSVGSGTSAVIFSYVKLFKSGTTTGLSNSGSIYAATSQTSAGFASTTQTKISLGFNGGTSFVGSNNMAQADYEQ